MQLPYAPDDDDAAEQYVNREIRHRNLDRWRAMCSDPYILQTHRILLGIDRKMDATFAHRNGEVRAARADYQAGDITNNARADIIQEYDLWKESALVFRSKVRSRREEILPRVRQLNGDNILATARSMLLALARAVADHQVTVERDYEPTVADRTLWARLPLLTYPAGFVDVRHIPLVEAIREPKLR